MNNAHAHQGADQVLAPGWSLLAEWTFDPVFGIPLLLAVLYGRGYLTYRRRGGRVFPARRPFLFTLGLGVMAVALLSPVDLLAGHSFIWHMVQHDLITLVGAPLLLLGAPFIPVVRGLPVVVRRVVFIPLARNRAVRWLAVTLTRPLIAIVLFELNLLFWHFPAAYDRALSNEAMHYAMHASFILTSLAFWWNLVSPFPFSYRLHPLQRMLMLFASSVVNTALSSVITFSPGVLYAYQALPGFWGLSMREDQFVGGFLMWSMGAMWRLGALSIIFAFYAREESRKEPVTGTPQIGTSTAGAQPLPQRQG